MTWRLRFPILSEEKVCVSSPPSQTTLKNQQADWEQEEATPTCFVNALETAASEWYDHIKFFLHNGFAPETLDPKKHRALRLKSSPYQLINDVLFRKNYDGVFLRCLEKDQTNDFLFHFMQDLQVDTSQVILWLTKLSG